LVLGKLKNWPGIKSYTLSITIFLSRQFLSSDCFWCAPFGYLYFHLLNTKSNYIHPVSGVGAPTQGLLIMKFLPLPLNHGYSPC
jgi:hypothetical protein